MVEEIVVDVGVVAGAAVGAAVGVAVGVGVAVETVAVEGGFVAFWVELQLYVADLMVEDSSFLRI